MGLDSVLRYPSMQLIQISLIGSAIGPIMLNELYPRYDGYASPRKRAETIDELFGDDRDSILRAGMLVGFDIENFVVHLCHSIWIEENANLPWSLKDYSVGQMEALFDRIPFREPADDPLGNWANRSDWTTGSGCWGSSYYKTFARQVYQTFPISRFLVKPQASPHAAALSMVSWILRNFFHPEGVWGFPREEFDDFKMPDFLRERISGCHGLAKLLVSLLRSVNIPAIEVHETFDLDRPASSGHGVCYIPSLECWVHGDYLADIALLEDNSLLLMDKAAMDKWVFCTTPHTNAEGEVWPRGYNSLIDHTRQHGRFGGAKLWRKERDLYLNGESNVTASGAAFTSAQSDPGDLAKVRELLPEYDVHQVDNMYHSRFAPIQGLEELSASHVKVEFFKSSQGEVSMLLKNKGHFPVPTDDGVVKVTVDKAPHAEYALSTLPDQDYRLIGYETYIPTGIVVTGKESKRIAAYLSGLPTPWPKSRAYLECTIKGNVNRSKGTRIYHTPRSRYYKRTRVDLNRGDRWFCSIAEAQATGFRPPKR